MPPVKVEGGGEQLDWGESLTKTKEETAQQKKWGTYIYILSFFLGGGCLGKLSLFIFQTLEVPSCEVFRAWLLGCDIFFFLWFPWWFLKDHELTLQRSHRLRCSDRRILPQRQRIALKVTPENIVKQCETGWSYVKRNLSMIPDMISLNSCFILDAYGLTVHISHSWGWFWAW